MKSRSRILFVLVAVALLFFVAVRGYEKHLNHHYIYPNIYIDDLPIGGLTREQATQQLDQNWQTWKGQAEIHLFFGDQKWHFYHDDIQLTSNYEQLVEQAYSIGRGKGLFSRIKEIYVLRDHPISLTTEITYQTEILKDKLEHISEQLYQEPVDASFTFNPDASDAESMFVITGEQLGRELHSQLVLEEIKSNFEQGNFNVSIELKLEEVNPQVFAKDFEGKTEQLVSFSTDLSNSAGDRTHNVVKATLEFNGVVLQPGEVLSFNGHVGERTAEKGYRSAPMIVADKSLQNATGGGVSQTSSTLYNAAIRAGLEAVEFQRHSFPVAYIQKGLDTTVNLPFPVIDLKVKNTRNSPVYFRTFYSNDRVHFEIYGETLPHGRTIKIRTEEYETVAPPPPEIRKDEQGKYVDYEDQKYTHVAPRSGYKVRVYRDYLEGDQVVESELLDDHYYRPIAGIIYVGKNKRPASKQEPDSHNDTLQDDSLEKTQQPDENGIEQNANTGEDDE